MFDCLICHFHQRMRTDICPLSYSNLYILYEIYWLQNTSYVCRVEDWKELHSVAQQKAISMSEASLKAPRTTLFVVRENLGTSK